MKAPLAWKVYIAFCLTIGLVMFSLVPIGMWLIRIAPDLDPEWMNPRFVQTIAGMGMGIGAVAAFVNISILFLPRNPVGWSAHLSNLIVSLSAVVTIPVAAWLIVQWKTPAVKRYFGVPVEEPPRFLQ